jgi:hypothetical protein
MYFNRRRQHHAVGSHPHRTPRQDRTGSLQARPVGYASGFCLAPPGARSVQLQHRVDRPQLPPKRAQRIQPQRVRPIR